MALSDYPITGLVARLVTNEDLLINKGYNDGVTKGMLFDVLDPLTQDVYDPATGEPLGSIDRILATVYVTEVMPRLSMAHLLHSRGLSILSDTARIMSGYSGPPRPTGDSWPEGVKEGDPVGSFGMLRSGSKPVKPEELPQVDPGQPEG